MGARASAGPQARAGLLLLLPLLLGLLGLLAPGAQAARGRGGTEKNSYRRTVNTFSQSVSSLFGEDNVRIAQKVGVGPAPAVTLPRPPRTWRRGLPGPCAASAAWKRGAQSGDGGGRPAPRGLPGQCRLWWPVPAWGQVQSRGAPSVPRCTSPWTLPPRAAQPGFSWAALTPTAPLIHSFNTFERTPTYYEPGTVLGAQGAPCPLAPSTHAAALFSSPEHLRPSSSGF